MRRIFIITLLSSLFWAGCSSRIIVDKDPSVAFETYRTYKWNVLEKNNSQNPIYKSELINQSLTASIDQELSKKGYVMDESKYDFLVDFHIYVQSKTVEDRNYAGGYYRGERYYSNWGYEPGPYNWNEGFGLYQYDDGTLLVDIVDAKSNKLVWRGATKRVVDEQRNISRDFAKNVARILHKFPSK